ncbi:DNA-binding response regulator [Paraburkholderia rhynchosiae]|uniref:Response regulatory domain-containing protein n=1 Tax=Paraburkholderia rhynchosiae TaxID=487049 RepID=A0A6J5C1G3_9BURK|nr:LuxR C-terminal-related transcriptional regulator [Paraburkholderia rhynchosiae]CAB3724441.1 hypothetical protein LMG27174_05237 [Paraburkholderia rhynchosiae]
MTGLAETEHVLQGFQAGGVDYIPKPIRPAEVIVRIASHLRNSRLIVQTRAAIDAAGQAVVAVAPNGEVLWLTPLAQSRLRGSLDVEGRLPAALCDWLHGALRASEDRPFELLTASEELIVSRLRRGADGEELLMIHCKVGSPEPAALTQAFRLPPREADVLYWVAVGKTNRDIADILGMSPRTANKHLEKVGCGNPYYGCTHGVESGDTADRAVKVKRRPRRLPTRRLTAPAHEMTTDGLPPPGQPCARRSGDMKSRIAGHKTIQVPFSCQITARKNPF